MASEMTLHPMSVRPPARPWPAEVHGLLSAAEQALLAEDPQSAFDLLSEAKEAPSWLANARGVCLLRMGEVERALDLFRGLALAPSGFGLRHEAPTVFKTNYATAQLLSGNLTGCIVTLGQAQDDAHPSVQRLRAAIRRWRQGLSFWDKVRPLFGGSLPPVELDFPPGDL